MIGSPVSRRARSGLWRTFRRFKTSTGSSLPARRLLPAVRDRCKRLETLTDNEIERFAESIRTNLSTVDASPVGNDDWLHGIAVITECVRRETGMTYHDVQLVAGHTIASGQIAEMATGEGKTIVAGIPSALGAMQGRRVHVATTNEYLARRDFEQLKGVFERLGLTASSLKEGETGPSKAAAYRSDIVYGTGYEFGFDMLRDQLTLRAHRHRALGHDHIARLRGISHSGTPTMQLSHDHFVIDEIDSVLLDEAMTPLIISASAPTSKGEAEAYSLAEQLVSTLARDVDFQFGANDREIVLTDQGHNRIEEARRQHAALELKRRWDHYVQNALQARFVFKRDVDYVVMDGKIQIVDQQTGRIHDERTWQSGLHQAVEAHEGVEVTAENQAAARISRQNYAGIYQQISGMTGTAQDAESEFRELYSASVVPIPRHRPLQRELLPERFFQSADARSRAIAESANSRRLHGQPVLIGTRTIRQSEEISDAISKLGVDHLVLNGKQDQEEAEIIAQAGQSGAVTIATNMAGRGTDIKPDSNALDAGGLHVIVAEHHLFRRVDRQLIGRCARQGDPGSCELYTSADDVLLQRHGERLAKQLRQQADHLGEIHRPLSQEVSRLQAVAEDQAREVRRQLMQQDAWQSEVLNVLARDGRGMKAG